MIKIGLYAPKLIYKGYHDGLLVKLMIRSVLLLYVEHSVALASIKVGEVC